MDKMTGILVQKTATAFFHISNGTGNGFLYLQHHGYFLPFLLLSHLVDAKEKN